jgi:sec-independent protein translocase protein TatC
VTVASAAIGRLGHGDRASVVEHLGELRTRLIVSLVALAVAFGFCLWQNHALLHAINGPLERATRNAALSGHGPLAASERVRVAAGAVATAATGVATALDRPGSGLPASTRNRVAAAAAPLRNAAAQLRQAAGGERPVTLGIGEPFTATLTVTFIFALILALPLLLYQLYAFVLPAFNPQQVRTIRPLVLAIPFLFAVGVLFGYAVVLPAAVKFLQGFNRDQFTVLVQASQYYRFAAVTMLAMGLVFQVPIGILAATRGGLVTPRQLRANRRYAVMACAAVAAFLPGDVTTLLLETVPLYALFEISVLLAAGIERRAARRAAA